MKMRYFDHVATNPMAPEVLEAMLPFLKEEFGNPLSMYDIGSNAKNAIEKAREEVAALINAKPTEIVFTSSGAEANNFALKGIALARQKEGNHIITTKMEHHSITNTARSLEKLGFVVTYIVPDRYGVIDPEAVQKAINKDTVLISVTHASSEVGTLEPINAISAIAHSHDLVFHVDAVATTGNIPVDVQQLDVDLLSIAAHQFYGPKGAGALYLKTGQRILPLIYGGIQESGRRAGTENVPAIVGMGKAAELARNELPSRVVHSKTLRDKLISGMSNVERVHLTGHPLHRLPGHASFVIEFIEGEGMLLLLSAKGVYAASGSACTSKALKASPALTAMGVPTGMAHGSIVFSMGKDNAEEDIDFVLEEFPPIIKRLRDMSPFAKGGWSEEKQENSH
jgi:cysteine desulfurase